VTDDVLIFEIGRLLRNVSWQGQKFNAVLFKKLREQTFCRTPVLHAEREHFQIGTWPNGLKILWNIFCRD